jgi:hypothetical protein
LEKKGGGHHWAKWPMDQIFLENPIPKLLLSKGLFVATAYWAFEGQPN